MPLDEDTREQLEDDLRDFRSSLRRARLEIDALEETALYFETCAVDSMNRSFTIENKRTTRGDTITIYDLEIVSAQGADWRISPDDDITVASRRSFEITVTFRPREMRVSTATVTFRVQTGDEPKNSDRTVTLHLIGDGTHCPEFTNNGSSVGAPVTDPAVAIGAGVDANGNALPPLNPHDVVDICLAFFFVQPADWDSMTDEQKEQTREARTRQADTLMAEANAIFAANRAKIMVVRPGPVQEVEAVPDTAVDPHCMDVFLDPGLPAGSGSTRANEFNPNDLPDKPDSLDDEYGKILRKGNRIVLSSNGALDTAGKTFAHEIGHALGLGQQPQAQPEDDHREVDDADSRVKDDPDADRRLMRHLNPGKELTRAEVDLAEAMANWINAHKGRCKLGSLLIPGGDQANQAVAYAYLMNQPDWVEVQSVFKQSQARNAAVDIRIEITGKNPDKPALFVSATNIEGKWYTSTYPAIQNLEHSLQVFSLYADELEADAEDYLLRGAGVRIPRKLLPEMEGILEWKVLLSAPEIDLTGHVPESGFASFDITLPDFTVSWGESVEGIRQEDAMIYLDGLIETTSTFSGDLDITIGLVAGKKSISLPMARLINPVSKHWSVIRRLPDDIEPGDYEVQIKFTCAACQVSNRLDCAIVVKR